MPIQYPDCDGEGGEIEWPMIGLVKEAHKFAGIIITVEGERWNVPSEPSPREGKTAQAMSEWGSPYPPRPGESLLDGLMRRYLLPDLTDAMYRESPLIKMLKSPKSKLTPKMPRGLSYARYIHQIPEVKEAEDGS